MRFAARAISIVCLASAVTMAQTAPQVVHLWDQGAPGFESRRDEPEVAKDYWIRNIQNPSITVFLPPKEKANGAAVLIVPGGGHRELVFNAEGRDPALPQLARRHRLRVEISSRPRTEFPLQNRDSRPPGRLSRDAPDPQPGE